jgi:hypothetical protein
MSNTYCIYCNSSSYGTGCVYSPTETHVHMDSPGTCIYCGATSIGNGCVYNPYGDIHVRGPEFLNRSAVQAEKASVLTYFLNMATSIIEESRFYKSPLDRLYRRISGIIATISEPFLETLNLQETPSYGNLKKEQMIKTIEYKKKFQEQIENLAKTITEANLELPQEIVEKSLVDAIMNFDVRKKN